jgi:hypothetical protein
VQRTLTNSEPLIAWAKEQGFKTVLEPKDLHVAVVYSKEAMKWDAVENTDAAINCTAGKVVRFDGGAVVLKLISPELQARHKEFKAAGASYDFPSYQPHVTLSYDAKEVDLTKITPYEGVLEFGPEQLDEIRESFDASTLVEKVEFARVLKTNPYHGPDGLFAKAPAGAKGQTKVEILKSPKSTYSKLAELMDANTEGHIDVQAVKAKLKEGGSLYLEMKEWPLQSIAHQGMDKEVDPKRASSTKGSVIIGKDGEILDGRHRIAAAMAAGKKTISAWVPADTALTTASDVKKKDFFSILKKTN